MSLDGQRISPARLAWIMNVSDSTVEEWVRLRKLPSFKVGRVRRFAPEDVMSFICRNTVGAKRSLGAEHADLSESLWQRIERLIRDQMQNTELSHER